MSARALRSCEDDVLVGIGSEIPVGRVRRREDAAPPRIQIASDQHDAVLRPAGHEGDRRLAAEHGCLVRPVPPGDGVPNVLQPNAQVPVVATGRAPWWGRGGMYG